MCSDLSLTTRWIEKEDCVYRCAHNRIGVAVGLSQASPHTHHHTRPPSGLLANDWCKHPPNAPYVPPVHVPVMSSVLARYEAFLVNNVSAISSVESTLRSVTWILPGRFKDAELTSEACTDSEPPPRISLDFLFQWLRC